MPILQLDEEYKRSRVKSDKLTFTYESSSDISKILLYFYFCIFIVVLLSLHKK